MNQAHGDNSKPQTEDDPTSNSDDFSEGDQKGHNKTIDLGHHDVPKKVIEDEEEKI